MKKIIVALATLLNITAPLQMLVVDSI